MIIKRLILVLSRQPNVYYRPQTKFAKVMFLQVSVCPQVGEACVVARGACMVAQGGMRGCSGGMRGCSGGCMVALGGVCGFFRGCAWFFLGGHVWFFLGGVRGFCQGVCMVFSGGCMVFPGGCAWFFPGGACIGYDEIWSMSGRYASYWNAFLFQLNLMFLAPARKLRQFIQLYTVCETNSSQFTITRFRYLHLKLRYR